MQTILEPRTMQAWADATRARGERIALVPTMGALHEGHVALVAEARRRAKRVVVSIFVNPIQFDRRDDFERYPRTLEDDAARCAAAGVDVIFAPSPRAMYPEGFQTAVEVAALTVPLCGKTRPGHFRGVTTVVTKLFHAVRPHLAVFGEKDWQQLAVVRRMAADLDFGIEIVGVPTVREADGLALSSRNRRLTPDDREAARCLPRALDAGAEMVATGETRPAMIVGRAKMEIAACPRARLEYAEVRDPETLEEVDEVTAPVLLGVAVWVGEVRLIDNRLLAPAEAERESARTARGGSRAGVGPQRPQGASTGRAPGIEGGRARERSGWPTGSGGIGAAERAERASSGRAPGIVWRTRPMMRKMLRAKIHRATVTQANVDYEGSITIDRRLMEATDLLPNEAVCVWNVTNGNRFETYAVEGPPDSGVVCVNGAAAHLVSPGDLVIIAAYTWLAEEAARVHEPRVVFVDEHNRIRDRRAEVAGPQRATG